MDEWQGGSRVPGRFIKSLVFLINVFGWSSGLAVSGSRGLGVSGSLGPPGERLMDDGWTDAAGQPVVPGVLLECSWHPIRVFLGSWLCGLAVVGFRVFRPILIYRKTVRGFSYSSYRMSQ